MSRSRKAVDRIREQVPIIEVLADYGYEVDTRGGDREQQFSCDLHGDGRDSKPSARVYPDNNQFFCFACGRSRDVLALVMEKESLEFWPAVRKIEKRYRLPPLPWEPEDDEAPPTPAKALEKALNTSEKPEQALMRLERFLQGLTTERSLNQVAIAGLWEAYDRIAFLSSDGGDDGTVVSMCHKVLEAAKQALKNQHTRGTDV